MNAIQQISLGHGLAQEADGSRTQRLIANALVRKSRDEYDRDGNVFPCQLLLEIEPAQAGKPDVDDNATRTLWALARQEKEPPRSSPRAINFARNISFVDAS